jgi:hypothetical protein
VIGASSVTRRWRPPTREAATLVPPNGHNVRDVPSHNVRDVPKFQDEQHVLHIDGFQRANDGWRGQNITGLS